MWKLLIHHQAKSFFSDFWNFILNIFDLYFATELFYDFENFEIDDEFIAITDR